MDKAKRYFYISVVLIIISLFLSAQNPLVETMFGSLVSLVLISSILNGILLFIAVITTDKSIKYQTDKHKTISKLNKLLPIALFIVIIYHIIVIIRFFGII
ncbi:MULTISPECIES: hypothetical protein [Mammaliicoccus]|uniref:Uncharacterized protein n=1 Tax=Mammaliicoccus vitulinus TaxID=71237 RepID=A0A2T4PSH3_9STAP|nr:MULTISPECIES: hypothetical protein [Mammaliicoccus]HAL08420.1 hypothetical protein [Staphylococcus sp.]MBM6628437.1 hypothetical protein [Mammaliicoccus vitulinus]MBO3078047.1 hypothetical protein [Mammaliicoccus vitulinus]MEB7658066.1 hypothetical protein [Mammaliicoccus vitulinus]PNZ35066.1 hypothetical protein CD107_11750 [Mammaliicoccus vitulinus]